MMDGPDIFRKSRALKNISTSTKTYVSEVAEILRAVINREGEPHPWQAFEYEKAGMPTRCEYRTFSAYLDDWSRLTLSQLRDLFKADCEISDLLDVATKQKGGNPTGNNQHGTVNNVNSSSSERPEGNSKHAGLRRLRKDRPDLHKMVLDGEMTTHAAMLEAGFRRPTLSIPNDPIRAAASILNSRHFGPDFAAKLKEAL